tara:strand:- start:9726 stop:10130 length:405 start_codon:yes stop_codon:yes gene_type:complete
MTLSSEKAITQSKGTLPSFYNLDAFNVAVKASDFDIFEEVDILVSHMRDPDPKVSLPALKHFRSIMKDVAQSNGLISNVHRSLSIDDEKGKIIEQKITTTQSLLSNLEEDNRKENQRTDTEEGKRNKEFLPPSS